MSTVQLRHHRRHRRKRGQTRDQTAAENTRLLAVNASLTQQIHDLTERLNALREPIGQTTDDVW